MTVLLNRAYGGLAAGAVVTLSAELEAALVGQGFASTSAAALTAGAAGNQLTSDFPIQGTAGVAAIAAGAASVVISNPRFTANHKGFAVVAQAAADATLTSILRVSMGAGTLTITGNANATAITAVSFLVVA